MYATVESWRRQAVAQSDPGGFRVTVCRVAAFYSGALVPADERSTITRAKAGQVAGGPRRTRWRRHCGSDRRAAPGLRWNRSTTSTVQADEGLERAGPATIGSPTVSVTHRVVTTMLLSFLLAFLAVGQASAQTGAPPWAACGANSSEEKPVRTFPTKPPIGGPNRTYSTLMCGNANFGFRHIDLRHQPDWASVAFYTGGNWRDLADFAMNQSLTVPQPGYPVFNPKNETWTYKAPLQIKDQQGNVRATYWPIVSVAARDGRIITSYPTRDPK
jgi:hypothetical protein